VAYEDPASGGAAVVELIITRATAAGKSYRDICSALESAGHRPRRAQQWQPGVVRRIALRREEVESSKPLG
jgi:hypothetical protein